jgi:7-carboxy-7-deazaguanine synthase
MRIVEIFRSIQGEGTQAGRPCTFVRLAGCNLRCAWCDTPCGQDVAGGDERALPDVVAAALAGGTPLLCVTGGEPLLQPGCPELVGALLAAGRDVQVFTNGSLPLDVLPAAASRVVDVKSPWAHRQDLPDGVLPPDTPPPHFRTANLAALGPRDEVKFVVRDRREFDWAAAWAGSSGLLDRAGTVWIGAAWGLLDPARVADWILASRLPLRLGLQWHKILWGAGTRR